MQSIFFFRKLERPQIANTNRKGLWGASPVETACGEFPTRPKPLVTYVIVWSTV